MRRRTHRRRPRGRRHPPPARRTVSGVTPGWSPSSSTTPAASSRTRVSAVRIEVAQPSPKSGLSTTSTPARSTRSATSSAAPPSATTTWSAPAARAVARVASSSVAPRKSSSCLGRPRRREPPAASTTTETGPVTRASPGSGCGTRCAQNQWSTPSTTACTVSGPIVTVIPQTGSTASVGRGAGDAPDAVSPSTRIGADHGGQDRQGELGRRAGADVEPDVEVHPRRLRLRERQLGEEGGAAGVAADHAHEPDAGVERGAHRSDLVAVGRDDHGGGALGAGVGGTPYDEAEAVGQTGERLGGRRGARDVQDGRRQQRLQVDLQGAPGQARVDHDAGAGRLGERVVAVGQHPQQQALSACRARPARRCGPSRRRSGRRRSPPSTRRRG